MQTKTNIYKLTKDINKEIETKRAISAIIIILEKKNKNKTNPSIDIDMYGEKNKQKTNTIK